MITPLVLLVLIGTVARFSRLIWKDDIATSLRDRIWTKWGERSAIGRLIKCPWCIAPYFAVPGTGITFAVSVDSWSLAIVWYAMLTAAAVSMFGSWLAAASYRGD